MRMANSDEKATAVVNRGAFWVTLRRVMGHVPFVKSLLAMYFATLDRKTPLWVKGTVMGAIAYFILPLDAIPDVILGLGFTDDAGVILAAYKAVSSHVTEDHEFQAQEWIENNRA